VTFDQTLIIQSSLLTFSPSLVSTTRSTSLSMSWKRLHTYLFCDEDSSCTSTIGIPNSNHQTTLFLIPSRIGSYKINYDDGGENGGTDGMDLNTS
jgi:hypothetical protein